MDDEQNEKTVEQMSEDDWKAATESLEKLSQERRKDRNKEMNETIRRGFGKGG